MDHRDVLASFRPKHDFLLCLDSDGCAFDTMRIKQRECFVPGTIVGFGLQPVAQAARSARNSRIFSVRPRREPPCDLKRILAELLPCHPQVRRRGFQVLQLPTTSRERRIPRACSRTRG
jgi:hypothetical protein